RPPRTTLFPYTTLFRSNPLKLCEFADRMLGTEKTSAKENFMRRVLLPTMVFCFFASGHFVSAAPQAEQKMEELSHPKTQKTIVRSEEHTSELQSRGYLV